MATTKIEPKNSELISEIKWNHKKYLPNKIFLKKKKNGKAQMGQI